MLTSENEVGMGGTPETFQDHGDIFVCLLLSVVEFLISIPTSRPLNSAIEK